MVWDTKVQDYKKGQYLTLMPLVVDGKVIVGGSGGEFGIRGYVVAFDAESGKELWRTFTIPGPGEPGNDTWSGDDWKSGGATGLDDRHLRSRHQDDLLGHRQRRAMAGRNPSRRQSLHKSVLALDPDSGKMKTYFQYHPNDSWDWDEVDAPMLVDLQRDGRSIKSSDPSRDATRFSGCSSASRKGSNTWQAGRSFIPTSGRALSRSGKPIVDPARKPVHRQAG